MKKKSKYRNLSHGIWFASKREAKRWGELKLLDDRGEIYDLRRQVRFYFDVNGVVVGVYVADFVYREAHGEKVVEDSKGCRTLLYKLKKKLMLACFGIEVREV